MKIDIRTGSHESNYEWNKAQFSILNNWLLSSENPYSEYFQSELLFLDDTNGFVSIIPTCEASRSPNADILLSIAKEVRKVISTDIYIYVDYVILPPCTNTERI